MLSGAAPGLAGPEPRILVVCFDNLGDLVFASALVAPLRERFPASALWVWCKDYTADIAAVIPDLDGVFASDPFWDRSPGRGKGRLSRFVRTIGAVRRARFDLAIVVSLRWQAAAAAALARIPARIGLRGGRNRLWLTVCLPGRDRTKPVLTELGRLLQPLGIASRTMVCRLDAARLSDRRRALAPRFLGKRVIALHPFASTADRCADPGVWLRAATGLAERGFTPLWFGTEAELRGLRRRLDTAPVPAMRPDWLYLDRLGPASLASAAAALSLAECAVGHDSGPLHVAAGLGIPTVGVFAPGEPRRTFPQGTGPYRMVAHPSPASVTAEEIVRAIDELLAETGTR